MNVVERNVALDSGHAESEALAMARGKLRIYLGAAAGVGKTYTMLNEGRRRKEYGEDVVIGFVEFHGRKKTAEQVGDLEVVPRKVLRYRNSDFEEMDLDAVHARHPGVALVDELAHTDVPGSRNEKRWQDIDELLGAGIDVISTMNIQHLESLNDVVEEITGVKQRETVPDVVVRRADELQLVDLTPDALRNRLARGDVYPAERIDTALANYFRTANLAALRELALAWLADRVEEGLEEYRERHGIEQPWETRERVLVALTGSRDGDRLVRRAARMAQRMHGDLVAVHVIPQDGLAAPSADLLRDQRKLVEEFGGTYHEVVSADAGQGLVDAARSLNATQIVMGASRRSRWQRFTRGSVIGKVIRASGTGIDVHVVSHPGLGDPSDPQALPITRRPATLPRRRVWLGLALAVVGLPALTAVLTQLREQLELTTILLLYLLLVLAVSAVGGLLPALGAAIAAFLLVNWYFTPPLHQFTIDETQNLIALIAFLAVAATVSGLVSMAARRAAEGTRARAEAEALARLAGVSPAGAVLDSLRRILGLDGAAVLHRRDSGWEIEAASGERVPETPEASASTIELDEDHVLALSGAAIRAEDRRVLDAFAKELQASVEVGELEAEAGTVGALAAANELRAALLSTVSQDLRAPIAAIKASVTSLLEQDVEWASRAPHESLESIAEEADRLNVLVGNLVDMSRLQSGALDVHESPIGLNEVLAAALGRIGADTDSLQLEVPESLPRVLGDPGLLERALANVLVNAIRYSAPGLPARVTAGPVDGIVDVRIADRGPSVAEADQERLFIPFHRLGDSRQDEGAGLGLAVAKGFVEAMGGEIEVETTPGGGLTVVVRLRAVAS